jgi:hypothetical protein
MANPFSNIFASAKNAIGLRGPTNTVPDSRLSTASIADPLNKDNQIAPGDWRNTPDIEETDDESAEVEMMLERYRDAANHRKSVEREWVLSVAMVEGRQWLGWDDATHRAINLADEDEKDRYVTDNLVRPLLAKLVAMATMTKPDATPAPQTDSPMDRGAAAEGRVICGHLNRLHGGDIQTQEVAFWAAIGVGYIKHYWDPSAKASIPRFGPHGQIVGKTRARIGEEKEDVVAPFELYIDPIAKRWSDAGWLIHASVKPLSWFQERYGERGKLVEPDQKDGFGGYVDTYLTDGYGGVSQLRDWFASGVKRKAALCIEMWEKPTPRYPKGRYIVVAGKRRMYSGDWPIETEDFPFSRLTCQEALGHPYGMGLVKEIAPLQIAYNRLLSRVVERIEQDKLTVTIADGSKVGADAYDDDMDDGRNVRKIYWDPLEGQAPQFQQPPGVTGDVWRLRDAVWLDMQHIVGIHDVNMGGTPTGVTAGISIELLQQGDRTQLSIFTGNIEQYAVQRDTLRIALYSQYASGNMPRLMGLDDTGNPAQAQSRAMAFRALTAGGSCDLIVTPGSAPPKSPAGQKQEVMDFLKAGLYGPPGSPDAAYMAVQLMSLANSDAILEHLRAMIEAQRAANPGPAVLQAQQNAHEQQAMQLQLQGAQAQSQIQVNAAQQELQTKLSAEAQLIAIKGQVDADKFAAKHQSDVLQLMLSKVVPQLSGKMDPAAVVDLEGRLGLKGAVPPPTPAASLTPAKKNFTAPAQG